MNSNYIIFVVGGRLNNIVFIFLGEMSSVLGRRPIVMLRIADLFRLIWKSNTRLLRDDTMPLMVIDITLNKHRVCVVQEAWQTTSKTDCKPALHDYPFYVQPKVFTDIFTDFPDYMAKIAEHK